MNKWNNIIWNKDVKMIISDVDDTIAPVYNNIEPKVAEQLETILKKQIYIFLISGQSIGNIYRRVVRFIGKEYRRYILVGHCNGAEVYGYNTQGELIATPIYSVLQEKSISIQPVYEIFSTIPKKYGLKFYYTNDIEEFLREAGNDSSYIMADDRNVQLSLDFINGTNIKGYQDIRTEIVDYVSKEFLDREIMFEAKIAGLRAIDFSVSGVNKGNAIKNIMKNEKYKYSADELEIWGDSFSKELGGADFDMSMALPKEVRTISFRDMERTDFIKNYNFCIWKGKHSLDKGLGEYLETRILCE